MKNVLILGDGDLTYSLAFAVEHPEYNITASVFLSEEQLKDVYSSIEEQIYKLEVLGIKLMFEIDATSLLFDERFDVIYFNFPHTGGKGAINRNKELLRKFFKSVVDVVSEEGKVKVSLLLGQGGTPADGEKQRLPGNHWNIQDAAAQAGFILTNVCEFEALEMYCSSGYRGTKQSFLNSSKKGLTHTFALNNFRQEESLLSLSKSSYLKQFLNKWHIDEKTIKVTYFPEQEGFDDLFKFIYGNDDSDLCAKVIKEFDLKCKKDVFFDVKEEVQLYPPHYTHDLSLWGNITGLIPAILNCLGLAVHKVTLKEVYHCPRTARVSHSYSITYSHPHQALSKSQASTLAHTTLREYLTKANFELH